MGESGLSHDVLLRLQASVLLMRSGCAGGLSQQGLITSIIQLDTAVGRMRVEFEGRFSPQIFFSF